MQLWRLFYLFKEQSLNKWQFNIVCKNCATDWIKHFCSNKMIYELICYMCCQCERFRNQNTYGTTCSKHWTKCLPYHTVCRTNFKVIQFTLSNLFFGLSSHIEQLCSFSVLFVWPFRWLCWTLFPQKLRRTSFLLCVFLFSAIMFYWSMRQNQLCLK